MKRIISIAMLCCILFTLLLSANVSAADIQDSDNDQLAIFEPADANSTRGWFSDYVVYADKWWIMSNGIGVGAEGWTDVDYKSNGSNKYHYSNIQVYSGSLPGSHTYESGRKWGYGRVRVSTGNLGHGAMYSHNIFYGW